ncbi:MAG TPA: pinensin family lanthipeptide [Longimicrobium sp.]|nr:pinensin family lanthipeptide [Longimicrobium sp.]
MDKTVLNLDDLLVDSFTTSVNPAESSIDWTGCMSECGAC